MSKKSKSTQTNTPGWSTPPATPQSTALEGMVGKADFATPIRNQYARAKQNLGRSYVNPLGSFTTPHVRDIALREQNMGLDTGLGMALGDAALQNQQNTFNQQGMVAQLAQPRMYMAKSQNETKESDPFGTAMQIAGLGTSIFSGGLGGLAGGGKRRGTSSVGGGAGYGTYGGQYPEW